MLRRSAEWPTLAMMLICYAFWLAASYWLLSAGLFAVLPALIVMTAFHTSLQHEVVHGHPTRHAWLNEALVSLPLILILPFRRYRDLHLKHHEDANLTDPYDDPESYFWTSADVKKMHPVSRHLYLFNNTFAGRMIAGPALTIIGFLKTEARRLVKNEPGVRAAWLMHGLGVAPVIYWITVICQIPLWLYLIGVSYPAIALISVRSFAEHRAAESVGHRSAIVEAHPFFAWLFLNNNLHIVHHAHPGIAWFELPRLYRERKKQFLAANQGYLFDGYWSIVRRFALRPKQPVDHPLWYREDDAVAETPPREA